MDDIECSFEIVGDGGDVDLDGGFGKAAPSHSAKSVASFPGAEYLFDPAPHPMDWLVPFLELLKRRLFVATPHASGDDPRDPALCTHRITEVAAAIGAVGEYLAGIIGQRMGACPAIVDVGRRDCNFLDQRGIGISPNMGLEAVNRRFALMLDPARLIIAITGRRNDRGIDKRSGLDRNRFGLELGCHAREQ